MIPVVFIHSGHNRYFDLTIAQACKRNPVYVLTDVDPKYNLPNCYVAPLNQFTSECGEFQSNYVHMCSNPYNYELFCFLRWFILKDFMAKGKFDTVFYVDSDVLLYVNAEEEFKKFDQYDLTLVHRTAAISSFFTYTGICNLCSYLLKVYKQRDSFTFKKLYAIYNIRKSCGLTGGICDMSLLDLFHYDDEFGGPGRVGEMMQIINNSTYDHNINVSDQYFEMSDGIKKVQLVDGLPQVYSVKLKRNIQFNSLHFQGSAKGHIQKIFEVSK